MRTMRNRNMEGLLANRLTGGGTDRGDHGYNIGKKTYFNTKGQEGRNFLKAVDRYHNKDDWDNDLGGGTSFLQGPTGDSEGYVDPLMRMGDTEALEDHLIDKASDKTAMLDRQKLLADPENELDRNEMDSEALDEWHQDQASEMQAIADQNTNPQMVGRHAPVAGPVGGPSPHAGMPVPESLLATDDAEKKKKKKGLTDAEKAGYAEIGKILTDKSTAQDYRPPAPPALSIKQGQVAFPGLLASQAPAQQQRYTPRGLV